MATKRTLPKAVLEYFRKQGKKGGKMSAAARMEKLTPERRKQIAKTAAAVRWGNAKLQAAPLKEHRDQLDKKPRTAKALAKHRK